MDFKIGYNVKPKYITDLGVVIFEEYQFLEGRYQLVEVTPTADECKAYNFKFNSSKCLLVNTDTSFLSEVEDNNYTNSSNRAILHSQNNTITGVDNLLEGFNYNNLIVGDNNKISSNISNTILSGTKGVADYNNSKVLGGNNDTDIPGERQAVKVIAAAATTDATPTISYLNNDGATMIKVPENTIISFSADVVVVRTGGVGSGNKGDFRKWHEEGAVVNVGGTLTIQRTKTLKVSSGTVSGWSIEAKTTGEYLYLEVVGRNNRDLKWAIQWNLTEIKTGVDLSA